MRRIDVPFDDARGAARDPAGLLDELRLRLARLPPGHPSAWPADAHRDGRPGGAERPAGPGGPEAGHGRPPEHFPGVNGSHDDSGRAGRIRQPEAGDDRGARDRESRPEPPGRAGDPRWPDVARPGTPRGDEPWGDEPWLAGPASRLAAAAGLGAGPDGAYRPWFMVGRAAQSGFAPPWFAAP
ncbi:MAG: hypothetical protein ACYCO9_08530 [Streptosporangiaceae bacterium]